MTIAVIIIVALVAFILGWKGGDGLVREEIRQAIKNREIVWFGNLYEIRAVGSPAKRQRDPVAAVKVAMKNGEFDSEIARAGRRNRQRNTA